MKKKIRVLFLAVGVILLLFGAFYQYCRITAEGWTIELSGYAPGQSDPGDRETVTVSVTDPVAKWKLLTARQMILREESAAQPSQVYYGANLVTVRFREGDRETLLRVYGTGNSQIDRVMVYGAGTVEDIPAVAGWLLKSELEKHVQL